MVCPKALSILTPRVICRTRRSYDRISYRVAERRSVRIRSVRRLPRGGATPRAAEKAPPPRTIADVFCFRYRKSIRCGGGVAPRPPRRDTGRLLLQYRPFVETAIPRCDPTSRIIRIMLLSERHAPTCSRAPLLRLELLRERRRLRSLGSRQHICHQLSNVCFWRREILLQSELPMALSKMRVRMVHIGHTLQSVGSLGLFRTLRANSSSSSPANDDEPPPSTRQYDRCAIPLMWWPLWCETHCTMNTREMRIIFSRTP